MGPTKERKRRSLKGVEREQVSKFLDENSKEGIALLKDKDLVREYNRRYNSDISKSSITYCRNYKGIKPKPSKRAMETQRATPDFGFAFQQTVVAKLDEIIQIMKDGRRQRRKV